MLITIMGDSLALELRGDAGAYEVTRYIARFLSWINPGEIIEGYSLSESLVFLSEERTILIFHLVAIAISISTFVLAFISKFKYKVESNYASFVTVSGLLIVVNIYLPWSYKLNIFS